MSFLFIKTYIKLLIHFAKKKKCSKWRHTSLGCEMHFLKLFLLLSVYFYFTRFVDKQVKLYIKLSLYVFILPSVC